MILKRGLDKGVRIALGVILLIFSIFGIYFAIGDIEKWFVAPLFLEVLLVVLGIIFLRECFVRGFRFRDRLIDFVIALFLIFFGLFPLGLVYDWFLLLPFSIEFSVSALALLVVLLAFSVYLLLDQFEGMFW
mgnify:CR=1 FL=1